MRCTELRNSDGHNTSIQTLFSFYSLSDCHCRDLRHPVVSFYLSSFPPWTVVRGRELSQNLWSRRDEEVTGGFFFFLLDSRLFVSFVLPYSFRLSVLKYPFETGHFSDDPSVFILTYPSVFDQTFPRYLMSIDFVPTPL